MGVLHGRDLLSPKYVTAIITDGAKRAWFVPIKYHIGDYFIAEINNQKYVFSMAGDKFTYQDTLVRSFQFIIYNTANYKPVSPENMSLLDMVTIANDLPRMNLTLFSVLKMIGQKEKKGMPYKIKDLKDWVEKQRKSPQKTKDSEFLEQSERILAYLDHLRIEEIVTPVKKITEFIEDDLIATDPKFPGSVIDAVLAAETENKRINNQPIKSKTAWMKWIAIFSVIGLILAVVYMAYDNGAFDSIVKPLEGIGDINFSVGAPSASSSDLVQRYPTPEAMKCAIERGELKLASVPPDMKNLVNSAECVEGVPQDGGVP